MISQAVLLKAFCPTGPGGGIDNSCSPTDGGGGGGFWANRLPKIETANPTEEKQYLPKSGFLRIAVQYPNGTVTIARERERSHPDILNRLIPGREAYYVPPDYELGWVDSRGKFYDREWVYARTGYNDTYGWLRDIKLPPLKKVAIFAKAFCPTGPGGGIDNSCAPGEGGGGTKPGTTAAEHVDVYLNEAGEHLKVSPNEARYTRQILARHDPRVLENIDAVAIVARDRWKDFAKKITGRETTEAFFDDQTRQIYVPSYVSEMTLNHEIGHAALFAASSEWKDYWISNFNPTERLTKYAHDGEEQFAEAYAAYVRTKGVAKTRKLKDLFADVRKTLATVGSE